MSFLQINNPDGTSGIKRPFRLSDIQDIWNGIKSLFKAISGQQFRIVSGFDLVGGIYSSGTVWYNGELYEYDSNLYPITASTSRVAFAKIAQDDRVFEGGDTRPFSYRYVCGGDALSGANQFTSFVANIEKYKSYLGDKSVSTSKLADQSVTVAKIATSARVPIFNYAEVLGVDVQGDISLSQYITAAGLPVLAIAPNASSSIEIDTTATEADPAFICTAIHNYRSTDTTLSIIGGDFGGLGDIVLPKHVSSSTPSYSNVLLVKTKVAGDTYYYDVFSFETRIK